MQQRNPRALASAYSVESALALIDMELVMVVTSVAHVKEAQLPLLGGTNMP
jgi:hypothetical protein